jgi:hypothetical protein
MRDRMGNGVPESWRGDQSEAAGGPHQVRSVHFSSVSRNPDEGVQRLISRSRS